MYHALIFLGRLVCLLPHRVAAALGTCVGWAWYAVAARRRQVAKANLANAFPEWSHRQVCRTARAAFGHFGRVLVDFLRLPRYADAEYRSRWLRVAGEEHLRAAVEAGRGVILVSAHWGNWELGVFAVATLGYPLTVIARDFASRAVTRFVNRTRGRAGLGVLEKHEAARPTLAALRAGTCIGVLVDQYAGRKGTPAVFFGRLCSTTRAPAGFALKTGAAVVPIMCTLQPDGGCEARFYEPIPHPHAGDSQHDVAEMTQRLTAFVEQRVRERPGQWLWTHRRWKPFDRGQFRRGFRHVETILVHMPDERDRVDPSLAVCEYLKAAYPHARLVVIVRAPLGTTFRGNPHVDEVIEYAHRKGLQGLLDTARTIRRIRRRYFHVAVLLTDSLSAALWIALAGIPLRVGTRGRWRSWLLTHCVPPRPPDMHQREHSIEIAATLAEAPRPGPATGTASAP